MMPEPNDAEPTPIAMTRTIASLERDVVNILAHATSIAALNAAHARGRNQPRFANRLAVEAMRETLDAEMPVCSEVVIGEGTRGEANQLFVGEKIGPPDGVPHVYLAIDPLEGVNLCSRGEPGAISVVAATLSGQGQLMGWTGGYFDKIVLGKDLAHKIHSLRRKFQIIKQFGVSSEHLDLSEGRGLLDNPVEEVVRWIARERGKAVTEVVAMVLERDRNMPMVQRLLAMNAQVLLIRDGDITAGLLALDPNRDVDVALGIGSAPEGVITAAIARVFQGYMEARWWLEDEKSGAQQRSKLIATGTDVSRLYTAEELASGNVMFALTGVTYNQYTPGVQYLSGGSAVTHTIYGRSRTGTVYERRAIHQSPPPVPDFSHMNGER